MVMQSVLVVIRAVIAEHVSGWSRLRDAGIQAAADRKIGESVKDAATRITGEYAGEFSSETASVRSQFIAAVLLGLSGDEIVVVRAARSNVASVNKPASEVFSWNEAQQAAAGIREDAGMTTSGRKGTGARTPTAATAVPVAAVPVAAGPVFPGVTTAVAAAPIPLADRWDNFGDDVKAAIADVKLRARLTAILKAQGFTLAPTKVKVAAKVEEQALPTAPLTAAQLIKRGNPLAVLN